MASFKIFSLHEVSLGQWKKGCIEHDMWHALEDKSYEKCNCRTSREDWTRDAWEHGTII
jgi:hypothetical protein